MPAPAKKFILDTNIYIDAARHQAANQDLQRFFSRYAPFTYLSSVVVHELVSGGRTRRDRHAIERNVVQPFAKRSRLLTPSSGAWERSAEALAKIRERDGIPRKEMPSSFRLDALLAASCREFGAILITRNIGDFERLRRVLNFEFIAPWPE